MKTSFFGFREGIPAPGQRGTFGEGSGLDAAALAAERCGIKKKEAYARALELKDGE